MDVKGVISRCVDLDVDVADLPGLRAHLSDLGRVQSWVEARKIAVKRRMDDLALSGVAVESTSEIAAHSNSTRRDSDQVGERSSTLGLIPELSESLTNGDVSAAHVDALGRGIRKLEPDDRAKFVEDEGSRLARLAKKMAPDQFARHVNDAVSMAQSDGGIANFEKQRRANKLRFWFDQITGMLHLKGEFDPESALKLTGRLHNLVEELFHGQTPDTCPDDPSLKQDHLRALALIALVENHTTKQSSDGRPAQPVTPRVDLIVVTDEQTLRCGLHKNSIIDLGDPGAVLPVETLRRLACMANIIPAVLSSDGVAVDFGRSTRLATRAQRRAMRAMYPSCGVIGCRVAFEQCVLHHIRYWENGGSSDLANMVPLCSKHHHSVHEGGWQLHLDRTTRILTIAFPDGSIQTTGPPHARAG